MHFTYRRIESFIRSSVVAGSTQTCFKKRRGSFACCPVFCDTVLLSATVTIILSGVNCCIGWFNPCIFAILLGCAYIVALFIRHSSVDTYLDLLLVLASTEFIWLWLSRAAFVRRTLWSHLWPRAAHTHTRRSLCTYPGSIAAEWKSDYGPAPGPTMYLADWGVR